MAINNTNGLQSNLVFAPETMEQAIAPYQVYKQEYDKQQAINDAVQEGIAKYAPYIDKDKTPESYNLYKKINDQIDMNANYIGTPAFALNLDSIRNMKYAYQDTANKFAVQKEKLDNLVKMGQTERAKGNPVYYWDGENAIGDVEDLNFDHVFGMKDPRMYYVDRDKLSKNIEEMAKSTTDRLKHQNSIAKIMGAMTTKVDPITSLPVNAHSSSSKESVDMRSGIPYGIKVDWILHPERHWKEIENLRRSLNFSDAAWAHYEPLFNGELSEMLQRAFDGTDYDRMSETEKQKILSQALTDLYRGIHKYDENNAEKTSYDITWSSPKDGSGDSGAGTGQQIFDNLSPLESGVISSGTINDYEDGWWKRKFDPEDSGAYSRYDAFRRLGLTDEQMKNLTQEEIDDEDFDLRDRFGLYGMRTSELDRIEDVNKLLDSENGKDIVDYMTLWDDNGNLYSHDDFVKNNKDRFTRMYDNERYKNNPKYGEFNNIVGNYVRKGQTDPNGNPILLKPESSEELMEIAYKDNMSALRSLGFTNEEINNGLTKKKIINKMREVAKDHLPRRNKIPMFRFKPQGDEVKNAINNMFPITGNDGLLPIKKITKIVNDKNDSSKVTFETEGAKLKMTDLFPDDSSKHPAIRLGLTPKSSGNDAGVIMEFNNEKYLIPFESISETIRNPIMQNYSMYQVYNLTYTKNERRINNAKKKKAETVKFITENGEEYPILIKDAEQKLTVIGVARANIQQALMQNMQGSADVWGAKTQK